MALRGPSVPPVRGRSDLRRAASVPLRPLPPRDWSHPDGFLLSEVEVNGVYDGIVTEAAPGIGIFVDFGSVKDGLLRVPWKYRTCFYRGLEVKGMTVISCDVRNERVTLELDREFFLDLRPRSRSRGPRARSESRGRGLSRPRARSRSYSRPQRDLEHPEGVPLEEVQEGAVYYDGVVTGSGRYGVFVDIGAVRDGRLDVPRVYTRQLKCGDVIPDCTVEAVDLDHNRIFLHVEDPETLVRKLDEERLPVEEFEVGMTVDGIINATNWHGVFVNVRAVKDGRLKVPRRIALQMVEGQRLEGLLITAIDLAKQHITLELGDDRQEVEAEPPPPPLVKERAEVAQVSPWSQQQREEKEVYKPEIKVLPKPVPKVKASAPAGHQRYPAGPEPERYPPAPQPQASLPRARLSSSPHPSRSDTAMRPGPDTMARPGDTPVRLRPKSKPVGAPAAQGGSAVPVAQTVVPAERQLPRSRRHEHPVVQQPQEEREALLPLESFQEGDSVNGTVLRTEKNGVVVDICATRPGLLKVSEDLKGDFLERDIVQGMRVESVDLVKQQIILSMEDPELSVDSDGSYEDQGSARRGSEEVHSAPAAAAVPNKPKSKTKPRTMETEMPRSRTKQLPVPDSAAKVKAKERIKNPRPA